MVSSTFSAMQLSLRRYPFLLEWAGKPRPGVRVEPFEFISNGGGGEALPCRVKRRNATFYEVIKVRWYSF